MNHNLLLLRNLYSSASEKYLKFKIRFDKAIQNGRFYKLNKKKQSSLVSRLKKLYERLKSLQAQLRMLGAGAALSLTLALSNSVQSQSTLGPFEENDTDNPFPQPYIGNRPMPAPVDIDNDGDLDVFVGNYFPSPGNIDFYENVGGLNQVRRLVHNDADNPLAGVNMGRTATPAFADVDGDGDYDMLLGVYTYGANYSPTFFFRNTGSATAPVFEQQTGASNPFNGITSNKYGAPHPVFVDFDNDTDVDLFVGSRFNPSNGTSAIQFYENTGSALAPVFTPTSHPLSDAAQSFYDSAPAFADLDDDGDLDVLIGQQSGYLYCFINNGSTFTQASGPWNPVSKTGNPMYGYYPSTRSSPEFADFDGDGDLDLLVGSDNNSYNSNIVYYENTDGNFSFVELNDLNINPFGGLDVGDEASITFVDLDNDSDLDAVIGAKYSDPDARVYINESGVFIADPDHQITNLSLGQDVIPVFVDIDNDGDADMFSGRDFEIKFFRNIAGVLTPETSLLDFGYGGSQIPGNELSVAFIDFDGDNDFDAFVGNQNGYLDLPTIQYLENQGTPQVPDFVLVTPPAPFDSRDFDNGPSIEENPNVISIDFDNDSDLDIVVSVSFDYGDESIQTQALFFENKSDGTFTELTSTPVEIRIDDLGYFNFFDLDGDGDLDAFAGTVDGEIAYLENTNLPPVTNVNSSILTVTGGEPIVIDPLLTITDPDNDDITFATVSISNFVSGDEELSFDEGLADANGISVVFDQNGLLTFIGKASVPIYQNLLRSVTFDFTGPVPGGRKSNSGLLDLAQDITFQVRDTDFTLATVSVVSLNIIPGGPASEINIYNAFSPNKDDNTNPFFKIEYIESVSPENKVTIYNRWGDMVFEISNYNNGTRKFEGLSDKGKELPTGTYFYKIEITGQTLNGYLSLKR